jgi:hypothetical protein
MSDEDRADRVKVRLLAETKPVPHLGPGLWEATLCDDGKMIVAWGVGCDAARDALIRKCAMIRRGS